MKKIPRHIKAKILTVLYLFFMLTPLSPLLLKSAHIAHAVTGECSGDCEIDGCSLEARANHTCCCAVKNRTAIKQELHDCCELPTAEAEKKRNENIDKLLAESLESFAKDNGLHVFKCGTPCGKNRLLEFIKLTTDETIPYHYNQSLTTPNKSKQTTLIPKSLTSRSVEPPVPPPKAQLFS